MSETYIDEILLQFGERAIRARRWGNLIDISLYLFIGEQAK